MTEDTLFHHPSLRRGIFFMIVSTKPSTLSDEYKGVDIYGTQNVRLSN
jgi:hypothetical protein